jgi:YhgE/Pip-like protein
MSDESASGDRPSRAPSGEALVQSDDEQGVAAIQELLRSSRFWVMPIVAVVVLMGLLAASYVGAIVNPNKYLHHFPIAIVNEDSGGQLPSASGGSSTPQEVRFGDQLLAGVVQGTDRHKFDLQVTDRAAAMRKIDNAAVYGAIIIPASFTSDSLRFGQSALTSNPADRPVIEVQTNPRAGSLGAAIMSSYATRALARANATFGTDLSETVTKQAHAQGVDLTGVAETTLAAPINVQVQAANPLPDNAGSGLSAFYIALLLLLGGFTGSLVINSVVDGSLGFVPTEIGPIYEIRKRLPISRWGTLMAKWVIVGAVALILSSVYLLVGRLLGVDLPNSALLWLYGAFAIAAVGITATSIMAVFGSIGLLINLVLFVILGLPWRWRPVRGSTDSWPISNRCTRSFSGCDRSSTSTARWTQA